MAGSTGVHTYLIAQLEICHQQNGLQLAKTFSAHARRGTVRIAGPRSLIRLYSLGTERKFSLRQIETSQLPDFFDRFRLGFLCALQLFLDCTMGLVDCSVRIRTSASVGVCDGDSSKLLSADDTGAFVLFPMRIKQ